MMLLTLTLLWYYLFGEFVDIYWWYSTRFLNRSATVESEEAPTTLITTNPQLISHDLATQIIWQAVEPPRMDLLSHKWTKKSWTIWIISNTKIMLGKVWRIAGPQIVQIGPIGPSNLTTQIIHNSTASENLLYRWPASSDSMMSELLIISITFLSEQPSNLSFRPGKNPPSNDQSDNMPILNLSTHNTDKLSENLSQLSSTIRSTTWARWTNLGR